MSDESTGEVAWNSAQFLIQEVSRLRHEANIYYQRKDFLNAFESLKAVKLSVIQSLQPEERTKLKNKEQEFYEARNCFKISRPIGFQTRLNIPKEFLGEKQVEARNKFLEKVSSIPRIFEDYSEMLSDMLERAGYLIPVKQDASKMKF